MRFFIPFCPILLLLLAARPAAAQAPNYPDSVAARLQLLNELAQSGNFEKAQLEAAGFRVYLQTRRLAYPSRALPIISGIYLHNKDEIGANAFFLEAERAARLDRNPDSRVALLSALAQEYARWQMIDKALVARDLLAIAQDSLAARRERAAVGAVQHRLDSLQRLYAGENGQRARMVSLERERAYLLAGVLAAVFLLLVFANFYNSRRWRRRLAEREMMMELERGHQIEVAPAEPPVEVGENNMAQVGEVVPKPEVAPEIPDDVTPFQRIRQIVTEGDDMPKIALLIEPNRQVVLYLKSLLSDRFHVETAVTANEGLERAADLLPDLIVCDAVLNGKTGIDVARTIKLSERTSHIPLILLTERFGNEGKLDALRAGAETWFTRPVLDDEFDATVSRLLDARKVHHTEFARFLQLYFTEERLDLKDPFLSRTVAQIEEHLAEPNFMADGLARKLDMTRYHFTKKLKYLTAKEPVQLIREMRLEKAKTLLEKRAAPPQVVAELVGFADPGTFSRAFKEYFGDNTLLLYSPQKKLS